MTRNCLGALVGVVILCAAFPVVGWAQVPDKDGNYSWRIVDEQGVSRDYLFIPENKIKPSIATAVIAESETYSYIYTIENGSTAKQGITGCVIELSVDATADRSPARWQHVGPTKGTVSRVSFFTTDGGIMPGSSQGGFRLLSRAWPGPVTAKCNAISAAPADEPDWLPEIVIRQVIALKAMNHVETTAIGPVLTVTSDMPFSFVVSSVVRAFRSRLTGIELAKVRAVQERLDKLRGMQLTVTLTELGRANAGSRDIEDVRATIRELLTSIADIRVNNPTAMALSLCLEKLLGFLPVVR